MSGKQTRQELLEKGSYSIIIVREKEPPKQGFCQE